MRVLVVGDGSDSLSELIAALESADLSVDRVGRYISALKRLEAGSYACVLTTSGLVDDAGVHVLRRIREAAGAPVVLLVGWADGEVINRARAAGVGDVLYYQTDDLDRVVDAIRNVVLDHVADRDLDRHGRLRTTIQQLSRRLVDVETRDDIESTVTEALVRSGLYAVAWVSGYDPETGTLRPRTAAGVGVANLSSGPLPDDFDWTAGPVVTDPVGDGTHATVSVPLASGEDRYGVLVLSTPTAVDESERDLLADLGTHLATHYRALGAEGVATAGTEPGPTTRGSVETFSGVFAHELRNHLQAAHSYLRLAREHDDATYYDRVERALERIDRLANEAAVVANRDVTADDVEMCDLAAVAATAWEHVRADDATFVVREARTVRADPALLELLLENLFRNAVEHGGPAVELRVEALSDGFAVEDTGPGVPPSDRERVFEWGYTDGDGTGIGLALVERVADAHGWTVELTEGSDGGARFEFTDVEVGVDGESEHRDR